MIEPYYAIERVAGVHGRPTWVELTRYATAEQAWANVPDAQIGFQGYMVRVVRVTKEVIG